MTRSEAGGGGGLVARARTMAADAAAVEVAGALRDRGIPSILLKGPALQTWLYHDTERDYVDADLLVPPAKLEAAEGLLGELGFERVPEDVAEPARGLLHSRPWVRSSDSAQVDLHRTIFGVGVGPERAWDEAWRSAEVLTVGGRELDVLGAPARALLVTIHAAQHEGQQERIKPLDDLQRALEQASFETWRAAAELAERLGATQTMTLGLALSSQGTELVERLGLVSPELARAATAAGSRAQLIVGLERLARTRGLRVKARLVVHELVPGRDFLYAWSPLARRGAVGMALVQLWRPLWLVLQAGPSLIAWLRFRRNGTQ